MFDAPWEHPSADLTKYFNYGLTPATWSAYQARVQQYREAFILQHKIPVLPDARDAMPDDAVVVHASFPPELKAALENAQLQVGVSHHWWCYFCCVLLLLFVAVCPDLC